MNELINTNEEIVNMIYEINGVEVMLDSDLAILFDVETKRINEAVKNNPKKFPERFKFRIDEITYNSLKSKISTSKGGSRRGHNAFTEQGIIMLASILKSDVAIDMSIKITDAFVSMRHYLADNKDVFKSLNYVNNKIIEHDEKIDYLFSKFNPKEKIYLAGEIYSAYSDIKNIFREAKKELVIIDAYADKSVLDMISTLKCNVLLIVKENAHISNQDIEKYNLQYSNLKVIFNDSFHDRYIVVDSKDYYHCGASINNAGKRTFSMNKLEDKEIKKVIYAEINKYI